LTTSTKRGFFLRPATFFALLGVAGAVALIAVHADGALVALQELGFGVLWMGPVYLLHHAIGAVAWGWVVPHPTRMWIRLMGLWVAASLNTVIPSATIGGEVAKARVLVRTGTPDVAAVASVIVDTTTQALSMAMWGVVGALTLVAVGGEPNTGIIAGAVASAFVLGTLLFAWLQARGGAGLTARALAKLSNNVVLAAIAGQTHAVDAALRALYKHPLRIGAATLVRLFARTALTLEVWLAAYLMGVPVTLFEALLLKSVTGAARGMAFVVPNGYGVQELAFVAAGAAIGIDAGFAVALGLATRAREIVFSLPALWWWWRLEKASPPDLPEQSLT
jgi:glycosyltransferase 2 family protein